MRATWFTTLGAAAILLAAPAGAASYYDDDSGFFIFLDAALTTPGNTDQVVGYALDLAAPVQTTTPLAVDWDSSVAGTFGFGYRWGENSVSVSYWQFDDDQTLTADGPAGGFINWAIGPATYYYFAGSGYYALYTFGAPGRVDFNAELKASLIDVTWDHQFEVSDYLDLQWSLGLRYASFEENLDGTYDVCASTGCDYPYSVYYTPGDTTFDVHKSNESDMLGIKVGIEGVYFVTDTFAISSGLAYSALQGDVESRSGLTPTGVFNGLDPPSLFVAEDDDRSGDIIDLDLTLSWYLVDNRLRLYLGYYQSRWDGIAADLARNTPGILLPNKDRDYVTFTGFKLGVQFNF